VLNRSVERAERLAQRAEAGHGGLEALAGAMARADVVVSSTGAAQAVIGRPVMEKALRLRSGGGSNASLFVLDLAVPRDVDPAVAGFPGVLTADLDDVKFEIQERGPAANGDQVAAAVAVVEDQVARFESWRRASRLAPMIQALRARGERAVAAELRRLGPMLAGLSEPQREAVEALGRGVAAKLLHDPIVRLKEHSAPGGDGLAQALAELFGIDPPPRD
jgi:glutamyl-tRNA reductase